MAGIILLCVAGLIVTEIYVRTRRPKLFALINSFLGVGGMLLIESLTGGAASVNEYSMAISAILGLPGAALMYILGLM